MFYKTTSVSYWLLYIFCVKPLSTLSITDYHLFSSVNASTIAVYFNAHCAGNKRWPSLLQNQKRCNFFFSKHFCKCGRMTAWLNILCRVKIKCNTCNIIGNCQQPTISWSRLFNDRLLLQWKLACLYASVVTRVVSFQQMRHTLNHKSRLWSSVLAVHPTV